MSDTEDTGHKKAQEQQPLKIADLANTLINQRNAHISSIIAKFQEQFRMTVWDEIGKSVERQLAPLKVVQERISAIVLSLEEQGRRHREQFEKLGKLIGKILSELEEFDKALLETHSKDKVFLSPFFMSLTSQEIAGLFLNTEKSAIEVYDEFFRRTENAEALLNTWSTHDYLSTRHRILKSAMAAHLRGEYELSIPIFLSQIEGVLREVLSVGSHSQFESKLKKLFPTPKTENSLLVKLTGTDIIVDIICKEMFESSGNLSRKDEKAKYPNRHEILHGVDHKYFEDPHASTRCILVLDLLRIKGLASGLQTFEDELDF